MNEQKIQTYVAERGYALKPHGCIIVKRAPETVPLALIELATQNIRWQVLCLCEHELVLITLSEHTLSLKRGSFRAIDYDDVRAVSVETADAGMTRRIVITLDDEELVLNAQREETSMVRTTGMFGAWHAENLPVAVKLLEGLGTPATTDCPAPAEEGARA